MKTPIEMPPIPKGSTEQQLKDLQDYLTRIIQQLNDERKTENA